MWIKVFKKKIHCQRGHMAVARGPLLLLEKLREAILMHLKISLQTCQAMTMMGRSIALLYHFWIKANKQYLKRNKKFLLCLKEALEEAQDKELSNHPKKWLPPTVEAKDNHHPKSLNLNHLTKYWSHLKSKKNLKKEAFKEPKKSALTFSKEFKKHRWTCKLQ